MSERKVVRGKRSKFKFVYDNGAIRFQGNRIIRDIMMSIEYRGLNEAILGARTGKYTMAELRQFHRLTETSASGYRSMFPTNKGARLAAEDAAEAYDELYKTPKEKIQ